MILVDIWVLLLDHTYDFTLNEQVRVGDLLEEIMDQVSRKEQLQWQGKPEELLLYAVKKEQILENGLSLQGQGIGSGEQLLLI